MRSNCEDNLASHMLKGRGEMCRLDPRIATGEDRSQEQRPPARVAVFLIDSSTVCSTGMHLHRITLYMSDRGSSNDRASLVGGALGRIFQPLRDQIQHHIPSCTAVWNEEHAPHHTAAKACLDRDPAWRLVLKPGRIIAPSRLRTPLRERAYLRKFAEPSDDCHRLACLSSVRACGGVRRQSRSCGSPLYRAQTAHSAGSCVLSSKKIPPLRKAVKQATGHPHIVTQGAGGGGAQCCRVPRVQNGEYVFAHR